MRPAILKVIILSSCGLVMLPGVEGGFVLVSWEAIATVVFSSFELFAVGSVASAVVAAVKKASQYHLDFCLAVTVLLLHN